MKMIVAVCAILSATIAVAGSVPVGAPDRMIAEGEGFTNVLERCGCGWRKGPVRVSFAPVGDVASVRIAAPGIALRTVRCFWRTGFAKGCKVYSETRDEEWKPLDGTVQSQWFFLVDQDGRTDGWGVRVQPNAFVCWNVRPGEVEAVLDVRAAGVGVWLGDRELLAAEFVRRNGEAGESAFAAGRAFCRMMCPSPRLPKEPVYGYNDWYCAYGANTATNFLGDAAYVVEMSRGLPVRPFVVMDDGWQHFSPVMLQKLYGNFNSGWGPWERAGEAFGMEMPEFARRIAALGAKPGLWYRPLRAWEDVTEDLRVPTARNFFDPTLPEVKKRIFDDVTRFRKWGFRMIKPDYITYDLIDDGFSEWAVADYSRICDDRIRWRDRSRTTAEVMLDIYRTIRRAAGADMVVIGCNAVNHFAAGLFELQRTGFDTSGKDWKKTVRCGVNAIGMRNMMNGTFYAADPDCIGLVAEGDIPWEKNRLWLDLIARSKSPLFVSWKRSLANDAIRAAFSRAFAIVCQPGDAGEPLDWQENKIPRKWRFADGEAEYDWLP